MHPKNMPFDRYISNRLNSSIVSIFCNKIIPDALCGYRAIRTKILKDINFNCNRFEFEIEFIVKACKYGFSIGFLDIPLIYKDEKSHIRKVLDTLRVMKLYFSFILFS